MADDKPLFDFDEHRQQAIANYQKVRPLYVAFAECVKDILTSSIRNSNIKISSVESRAKDVNSFAEKASEPMESEPNQPKYGSPLRDITDLAGVRVITFFLEDIARICETIESQFIVNERSNKEEDLIREERFGYQSIHYLVSLDPDRTHLPEYAPYKELLAEVQVRTTLQHAWAEIEHDIQYKSVENIPLLIRRRFMALAGLLELADREFQSIQLLDENQRQEARKHVERGELARVEITPDALKEYLDKKLGVDGRMTPWNYDWTSKLLRQFGFTDLQQVEACMSAYDDDHISRALWGSRHGQLSRFEMVLLAALGETYIERHFWRNVHWFVERSKENIERLRAAGVPIGTYALPALLDQVSVSSAPDIASQD